MGSPGAHPGLIRFGPFALDPSNRELRKRGYLVKLQPQHFAVLLLLTERAGQIVSREDIHRHIWGNDTFVDFERGINFSINQIRAALGDDAEKPRYIETIPRRGYRFIHSVELAEPANAADGNARADSRAATEQTEHPVLRNEPIAVLTAEPEVKERQTTNNVRRRSRSWMLLGLALSTLLILAAVFVGVNHTGLHLHRPWLAKAKSVAPRGRTVMLTNFRGVAVEPAFSPDGRQIAFLWNGKNQGKLDLYVQMIGGEEPLRLTHSGRICCIDWSPDGQWLSFARCDNGVGAVFKVPVLGGAERKVTDVPCIETDLAVPTWTLDGKSMLLGDSCVPNGPFGIVLFSFATGQKHCVFAPSSNFEAGHCFKLSPDGKTVAFIQSTTPSVGEINVVPLDGGPAKRLTADGSRISLLMWAADGKRIIFSSNRGGTLSERLWNISVNGGNIEPETVYPNIGAQSADGRRVAFQRYTGTTPPSIWRAELSGPAGRILSQKEIIRSPIMDGSPQLSPDQTAIAFTSARSGATEVWRSDADGSNALQLTSFGGELAGTPRWSPDGKWIALDRRPGAFGQIFVIDAEGRNLHAITSGNFDNSVPSWSRDGQSIYFGSMRSGEWQLWKQKLGDASPVQVTRHGGFTAFESYDGKTVYYTNRNSEGIWSVPAGGGEETRVTIAPRIGDWGNWAVSETGLYVLDDDAMPRPTIEFYNFKTRKLTPVIQLEHAAFHWNPGLDVSRDGRTVLYVQFEPQVSIGMVEDFQ